MGSIPVSAQSVATEEAEVVQTEIAPSPQNPVVHFFADLGSRIVTLNNTVQLKDVPDGFTVGDDPAFTLSIPVRTDEKIGDTATNIWNQADERIEVSIVHTQSGERMPATITKQKSGQFTLTPQKTDNWKPGLYELDVTAKESFIFTRDLTQNFSWGVLALNTNKSRYLPEETVELAFGILDERGHTLCDADLSLEITAPGGRTEVLSRENGKIKQSGECRGDSVTKLPDYLATYTTRGKGQYQMVLTGTNANGTHTISDYFIVEEFVPFEIERTSFPTRVYPMSPYTVELTVIAREDYKGTVQDRVPKAFYIDRISDNGTISQDEPSTASVSAAILEQDAKAYKDIPELSKLMYDPVSTNAALLDKTPNPITWTVDWKAGETYTLSYRIHFPKVSPEFFLIGPFQIGEFAEARQWQVANDAERIWDGDGSTNNWSDAVNWTSNLVPGSGDTAKFGANSSPSGSKNATIDTDITIQGITMSLTGNSYQGTITQGSSNITINSSTGFNIESGVFSGGSGNITFSASNTDFTQIGGTFIAPSGTMFLSDDLLLTGGTFNHNNGTITWNDNGDDSYTINANSRNFHNFGFQNTCGGTFTITNGTSFIVNGTLTIGTDECTWTRISVNGTGTIEARGNIAMPGGGINSSNLVTINGTGNQTIVGNDGSVENESPRFTINKNSGTLLFQNTFYLATRGAFTYTQGTIDPGTSTVKFATYSSASSLTINGSLPVNNAQFNPGCGDTLNLANGTMIVTGTTTFLADCGNASGRFTGTGRVHAQGDISSQGGGFFSNDTNGPHLIINGTGNQTISTGTTGNRFIPGIQINKSSGTLTLSGTSRVARAFTYTAGTLDFSGGTIGFGGVSNMTVTGSFTTGNLRLHPGCGDTVTLTSGTVITVTGDLETINECGGGNSGTLDGPGEILLNGDMIVDGAGFRGSGYVVFNGTGTQTISSIGSGSRRVPSLEVDKASGTVVISSFIHIPDEVRVTQGEIDPANSTVQVGGYGSSTWYGDIRLYNVTFDHGCGDNLTLATGTTLTINNFGSLTTPCGGDRSMEINGPGTMNIEGDIINTTNNSFTGSVTVNLTGTANQTINVVTSETLPGNIWTINKPSGTVTLANNLSLNRTGVDLTITSGTFNLAGYSLTVNDAISIGAAAAVQMQGGETITRSSLVMSGSATYTGSGTYSSLALGNSYNNLTLSGSGSFTPNGNVTVTGNFTQSAGTFFAPSGMTISGNFNRTGGTFTSGSGTVTFNDITKTTTLTGSTTFYNLTVSTAGKTIIFPAGATQTVNGTLLIRGTQTVGVTLRSSTPGSQWNLDASPEQSVTYAIVSDSDACSGEIIQAKNTEDEGNNECWEFGQILGSEGWYSADWTDRREIVVDDAYVFTDLTNYPFLVRLAADSDLASKAQADGDDIIFTDDAGNLLEHYIEYYSAGSLAAWVKIPSLTNTGDTTFYMYYNNPLALNAEAAKTAVFDGGSYEIRYDLSENPGGSSPQFMDSTLPANNGISVGLGTGDRFVGGIGYALQFAGNDQLTTTSSYNNPTVFTVEMLFKTTATGQMLFSFGSSASGQSGSHDRKAYLLGDGRIRFGTWIGSFNTATTTSSYNDGNWHHLAGVLDGSGIRLYVDGQLAGSTGTPGAESYTGWWKFGRENNWDGTGDYTGQMDELRISSQGLSAGHIQTNYYNQVLPSSQYVISGAETFQPSGSFEINRGVEIGPGVEINAQ
jgi:hypothetical protein